MMGGKRKRTSSIMEEVAQYYNIPSIDFGKGVLDLYKAKKLVMYEKSPKLEIVSGEQLDASAPVALDALGRIIFSKDGTHPFPNTGHLLYVNAIERSLPILISAEKMARPHKMPPPKYSPVDKVECRFIGDFGASTAKFEDAPQTARVASKQMWHNYKSMKPSDTLEFKFSGTMLGLSYQLGQKSGSIDVSVDGAPARNFKLVDTWSNYPRPYGTVLFFNLPKGEHRAVVKVSEEKFDKEKIIRIKNREQYLKENPTFLEDYEAIISAFFTDGKFIK